MLFFQRIYDVRTRRLQFLVRRIDIFGEHTVNGRFERRIPLPKEYRHITARHCPNFLAWVKPSNFKAECISVMLLCAFDISDRQLRHWPANRTHFLLCAHRVLLHGPPTRQIRTLPHNTPLVCLVKNCRMIRACDFSSSKTMRASPVSSPKACAKSPTPSTSWKTETTPSTKPKSTITIQSSST